MTIAFYTKGRLITTLPYDYWWDRETYKNMMEEAGFKNFTCNPVRYEGEKIVSEKWKSTGAVIKACKTLTLIVDEEELKKETLRN